MYPLFTSCVGKSYMDAFGASEIRHQHFLKSVSWILPARHKIFIFPLKIQTLLVPILLGPIGPEGMKCHVTMQPGVGGEKKKNQEAPEMPRAVQIEVYFCNHTMSVMFSWLHFCPIDGELLPKETHSSTDQLSIFSLSGSRRSGFNESFTFNRALVSVMGS